MRYLLIFAICLFILPSNYAQKSIKQVFNKYEDMDNVMAFNLTGDVLKLMNESTAELANKIDKIKALVFTGEQKLEEEDIQKIFADAKGEGFDELINARDKGYKVRIYVKEKGNLIKNLLLVADGKENGAIVASLTGSLTYEDFKKLDLNIEGMDFLKQLGDN